LTPPIPLWRDGALAGQQSIRRRKTMDKEKFEKMVEMMKGFCTDEGGMANCCSMLKKMMCYGEGKETGERKKDTAETE
jgi:hypothetical protein